MLDRYLYAVRSDLPKNQPVDDIVAEIGDDLQSRIEDRESALSRRLAEQEEAEIIKAYGHPRVVAARYGRVQYLIGPQLLPFYWLTLRLIATAVIAVELLGGGILAIVSYNGLVFFDALGAAWNSLIWIFGIVTVVFILGERVPDGGGLRMGVCGAFDWDPRRLRPPSALAPVPRPYSLAEFIANFLALLALLDAAGPHRVPLDATIANALLELHATLTPAWHAAYVGTITGTALVAISAIALFIRPQLSALHELIRAIASASVAIGIALTLQAGPWMHSNGSANIAALYVLVAGVVVTTLQVIVSVRKLLRVTRNDVASGSRAITQP